MGKGNSGGATAPACPYSELQEEWNRLCQESGLRRCVVFGDGAKRNAKARWAHEWFRNHWRDIFALVHQQQWCVENHAGIEHPLRRNNAERYINEVLDRMERQVVESKDQKRIAEYCKQQRERIRRERQ
jgi:hypothetical protein